MIALVTLCAFAQLSVPGFRKPGPGAYETYGDTISEYNGERRMIDFPSVRIVVLHEEPNTVYMQMTGEGGGWFPLEPYTVRGLQMDEPILAWELNDDLFASLSYDIREMRYMLLFVHVDNTNNKTMVFARRVVEF